MILSVASIGLFLVGCTTVTTQGFRTATNSSIDSSQIAIGADFSKYSQLLAEDMGIFFPQNSPSTGSSGKRSLNRRLRVVGIRPQAAPGGAMRFSCA